jgi:hypothetical protein
LCCMCIHNSYPCMSGVLVFLDAESGSVCDV